LEVFFNLGSYEKLDQSHLKAQNYLYTKTEIKKFNGKITSSIANLWCLFFSLLSLKLLDAAKMKKNMDAVNLKTFSHIFTFFLFSFFFFHPIILSAGC
jgi:hypothetical protein